MPPSNKNYNRAINNFLSKNASFKKYTFTKNAKQALNAFIKRTLKDALKQKPKK